jgi:tetratricopeptide (TPR) repeat protein
MSQGGVVLRNVWIVVIGAAALGLGVGCTTGNTSRSALEAGYAEDRAQRLLRAQRLAVRAENSDDPARQEVLLREAVDLFPQHSAFWTNLGTALAEQDDFAAAAEAYALASELDPTDPRPPYNLGALYAKRFWNEPALEHFERALDRDPNYRNALRGAIHMRILERAFDRELLEMIERAVVIETNERWLRYFQLQRESVRSELGLDEDADG